MVNPVNAELNPICHLLALLGAHHILHVGRIRVKRIIINLKTIFEEINTLPNYVHINISSSVSCYFTCLLNWNDDSIEFPCTNKASKFSYYSRMRLHILFAFYVLKSDGYKWKDTINRFTLRTPCSPVSCCKCRHNIYV
jgi:hypothetical protein